MAGLGNAFPDRGFRPLPARQAEVVVDSLHRRQGSARRHRGLYLRLGGEETFDGSVSGSVEWQEASEGGEAQVEGRGEAARALVVTDESADE